MKAHVIEIKHFDELQLFFFEEKFPLYDLFLSQIAQVFPARNDEEIFEK